MKTIWTVFGAGAAAAALAFGLAGSAGATMPKTLSITTSGKGGSWFAVGSRVIREVEKANPGLVTQVQTGGGLTNLRKIQAGQADIGMTFAFAAPMAYNAVAPFKKKHDKLTYLGVLFPGYLQIRHQASEQHQEVRGPVRQADLGRQDRLGRRADVPPDAERLRHGL